MAKAKAKSEQVQHDRAMIEGAVQAGRTLEYISVTDLLPAARNPKRHAEELLDKSVERFGYTEPVLLDERTGRLVAGHGRVAALMRLRAKGATPPAGVMESGGNWLIPVVRGWRSEDDHQAEAYLLASNRLTELGGWDDAQLAALLGELSNAAALEGVGFSEKDLEALLKQSSPPEVGKTPEDLLASFEAGEIKQVVLYFSAVQYEDVIDRLNTLREKWGVESNTDVFLKLLEVADVVEKRLFDATAPAATVDVPKDMIVGEPEAGEPVFIKPREEFP